MSANNTIRADGTVEFAAIDGVSVWWESDSMKVNRLPKDAPLEVWADKAGMAHRIVKKPVSYSHKGERHTVPGKFALVREDNGFAVGLASDRFQIVQPREVLEFFRDLIEVAGFQLKTAGTLHGGSKYWAQAEVGADTITRGTFNRGSVLLATGTDGTLATIAKGVTTEVVCANTLAYAMGEQGGSIVKVSHRQKFDAQVVKQQLGIAVDQYQKFIHQARELAKFDVSKAMAEQFVQSLLIGATDDAAKIEAVQQTSGYRKILSLFDGEGKGMDLVGRKGTLWGLVNGVTEYVDHHQRARSADNKFDSAQFGAGDELKTKAWNAALAVLA